MIDLIFVEYICFTVALENIYTSIYIYRERERDKRRCSWSSYISQGGLIKIEIPTHLYSSSLVHREEDLLVLELISRYFYSNSHIYVTTIFQTDFSKTKIKKNYFLRFCSTFLCHVFQII